MQLEIRQMSDDDAARIAAWRYDPPYDFYNADANGDDLALLLAAEHREGTSFSAFDTLELVGFYAFRQAGDDIVFGLGVPISPAGASGSRSYAQGSSSHAPDSPHAAFGSSSRRSTSARCACTCGQASSPSGSSTTRRTAACTRSSR
jgi:hypothetical protein